MPKPTKTTGAAGTHATARAGRGVARAGQPEKAAPAASSPPGASHAPLKQRRVGAVIKFFDDEDDEGGDDAAAGDGAGGRNKRHRVFGEAADNAEHAEEADNAHGPQTAKHADGSRKKRKHGLDKAESGKQSNAAIQEARRQLPVFKARDTILAEIAQFQAVVIVGETGSGKTTQLPQFLHDAGYTRRGMIAITQPRRVAAISIATRVSQEMQTKLGGTVGYSIRFEDVTSAETKIKYMTDGMLLRELLSDADLSRYSVIILDEAHERTLRTDVLFGAVKQIQKRRPELKIVVMSATLNAKAFSAYFNNAKIIEVQGRQFPVKLFYASDKQEDYVDAAQVAVMQIHKEQPAGDILVFLTGQEEIENLEKLLNEQARLLLPDAQKVEAG
nr:hypothetical protein HK105_006105 [Polyrhizophydium stewartii]